MTSVNVKDCLKTRCQPCPNCGSSHLATSVTYKFGVTETGRTILCRDCDHAGRTGNSQASAEFLWNQQKEYSK